MDTKTYNVNLKAKKTSWGGLALNLSKNGKLLGGVNKPMDSEMALVLTDEQGENQLRYFYSDWRTMESVPDEFILSPNKKSCISTFTLPKVKNINVSLLDTSNIENMTQMFMNCQELRELDLSSFNVNKVVSFQAMFSRCYKIKRINLAGWDTSNGTVFTDMFRECGELEEIKGVIDINKAGSALSNMFYGCNKLKQIKIKATQAQQKNFLDYAQVSPNTEVIFV